MAANISAYKKPKLTSATLQVTLVIEIATIFVATIVIFLSTAGSVLLPPFWFNAYQWMVKTLYVTPIFAGLCLLFWLYQVTKNARTLAVQPLETTPGWAVGWYFIPFANLWKPYEVMLEIYKASRTPMSWRKTGQASIVGWWWSINLIGNIVSLAVNVMMKDEAVNVRVPVLIMYVAIMAHQTLLLMIVRRIENWQMLASKSHRVEEIF